MNLQKVLRDHPLYPGYLYRPETPGPHPGILLLHGSEGGFGNFWSMPGELELPTGEFGYVAQKARYLASLGYVAYAFSYFHADDLPGFKEYPPNQLVNVDLKRTAYAFEWLKSSEFVQGLPVAIWGGSRGAEQSLILASLNSNSTNLIQADAIIADSPSDFVYPGLSLEVAKAISNGAGFPENFPPAWIYENKPIEMYTSIEVERNNSPLLVTYGAKDEVWGPYVNPFKLHERLLKNGIRSSHFDFHNTDNLDELIKTISDLLSSIENSSAIFIRFVNEGHSPRPGSSSAKLKSLVAENFIKTHLVRPR